MIKPATIDYIIEEKKNSNVILIGAGNIAREILSEHDWKILYCIDNAENKHGSIIESRNKRVPVFNWNYLLDHVQKDDILIITPWVFNGLVEQVRNERKLYDNDTFIYTYMKSLQWDRNRVKETRTPFEITKGDINKIPKKIHFFWFSGDDYPAKVQNCIESWKKFCPDYEIIKWDLTNYSTDNAFFNEAIENKVWAFASDFARCDVVYRYGGIYLDSDVELIKPLDDFLYDDGFMMFESDFGIDPGSGFGAVQGHSIIGEIREKYYKEHFVNEDGSFNKINIMRQYTDVLIKHGLISDGTYQIIDGLAVYPPLIMSPYSYMTGLTCMHEKTHGIHHWVSAWISDQDRIFMENRKKFFAEHEEETLEMILGS